MRKSMILLTFLFILVISPFAWALTDTKEVDILIDLTPPEISITGVEGGGIYSSPITPIVSAVDNNSAVNLDIILKRFNEQINWLSGQKIAEYGSYTLTAIAIDTAGNRAEEIIGFSLNTAGEPNIKINKERYTTGDVMTITVIDLNKTGQVSIEVIGYGIQENPKITCTETNAGTFVGKHTFTKGVLSSGFYVRYSYGDKEYIEANGYYDVSVGSPGGSISKDEPKEEPIIPPKDVNAPGEIISKVEGNEAKAPSSDTAVFKVDSDGNYVYVPTIYDPNTGKHIVLNQEEGEELLLIQLFSQGANEWVNPAKGWLEQRKIIAETKSENITKDEVARLLENSTGTKGVLQADTSQVTASEMNDMITQVLDISPLGKYVDRAEINKWAKDRQLISKPITRQEVLVTTYWFLQNIK